MDSVLSCRYAVWHLHQQVPCDGGGRDVYKRQLAGRCGKYFVAQQLAIGRVTGYIEERLGGQKVIKVFNHEAETMEEFDALNNLSLIHI